MRKVGGTEGVIQTLPVVDLVTGESIWGVKYHARVVNAHAHPTVSMYMQIQRPALPPWRTTHHAAAAFTL